MLDSYSREYADCPNQTQSEALMVRYHRTHDLRLRDRLVQHHEALVRQIALRFASSAEPLDDLIQVGTLSLIHAIDRFEPDRSVRFSTFAVPTILGEIKRYLRDATWRVRVPRRLKELYIAAVKIKPELSARLGHEPTVTEMSDALGVSEDTLHRAMDLDLVRYTVSFAREIEPSGQHGGHRTIDDSIGAVDEAIDAVLTNVDLRNAIDTLEPQLRSIIVGCYWDGLSQTELGEVLHISQMQVSRLRKRAVAILSKRIRGEVAR